MANYVILDTCIFKELGYNFFNHRDYKNIHAFTLATDGEMILSEIVAAEFENHFSQVLKKKLSQYNQSISAIKRDNFLKNSKRKFPDLSTDVDQSIVIFREQLRSDPNNKVPTAIVKANLIDPLGITQFILESKNLSIQNIQVRDFLIWISLLEYSTNYNEDRITFITKDEGFNNSLFSKIKEDYSVPNFEILKSIPEFLHNRGYNLPFVTEKMIQEKITFERIHQDLNEDIYSLLTYVSSVFSEDDFDDADVVENDIERTELLEFYSYKDSGDNKYKFVAHFKVYVKVTFEVNKNFESLPREYGHLGTLDSKNRPIFNAPILFFYDGELDMTNKIIKNVNLIDFLPWAYID